MKLFFIGQVIAPMSAGYFMFIPARIAEHRRQIIQLLNVTCGREDVSVSSDLSNRDDGYLLMVRCGGGLDQSTECPLWNGQSIQVEPTAETAIGLSHIQVRFIYFYLTKYSFVFITELKYNNYLM